MRTWVVVVGFVGAGCTAQTGELLSGPSDAGTPADAGTRTDAGLDAGIWDRGRDGGVDALAVLATFECVTTRRSGLGVELWRIDPLNAAIESTGLSASQGTMSSLAWQGDRVAGCPEFASEEDGMTFFDLASGEVTEVPLVSACAAVSASSRGWAVVSSRPPVVTIYDDFEAVRQGRASDTRPLFVSRVGVFEDSIVGAWHATDEVDVTTFDDPTVRALKLEGHDDWIKGLSPFPGGLLIIAGLNTQELVAFDAWTGRVLHRVRINAGSIDGLACRPRLR
ncbi:MAG: hypothetical protein RIT81_38945 [Deltaproteobacteria bacterium]